MLRWQDDQVTEIQDNDAAFINIHTIILGLAMITAHFSGEFTQVPHIFTTIRGAINLMLENKS